jgi:putative DNA primase/helicase
MNTNEKAGAPTPASKSTRRPIISSNRFRREGPEVDQIAAALKYIDPTDRGTWLRVAMSLKSELGDGGFFMWLSWSSAAPNFNERDARAVWRSIKPDGGVTIRTLFRLARQGGWAGDAGLSTTADHAAMQARIEADERKRAAEKRRAALRAAELWARLPARRDDHGYLLRKSVALPYARQHGSDLVLLVQDADGAVHGLQTIAPDGSKKLSAGTSKRGHFIHVAGAPEHEPESILIGEGAATVESACRLIGGIDLGLAAIDCGNLLPVAQAVRQRYPQARIIIAADDDRCTPGNPGLTHARRTAQAIGCELLRPAWPAGASLELSDFNDLARHLEGRS